MTMRTLQHPNGPRQVNLGGWKKQTTDLRDSAFALKLHRGFTAGPHPAAADNRNICSPVEDQGDLGSCTAQTFAGLVEANALRRLALAKAAAPLTAALPQVTAGNITLAANGTISFLTTVVPAATAPTPAPPPAPVKKLIHASRLFHYYATRKLEGTINEDAGATIRNAIKAGVQYGVCDETLWPYDISKFAVTPPTPVWNEAIGHKVTSYHAITDGDIETMHAVLSAPVPFLIGFGFQVYDAMLSSQMAIKGVLCRPTATEKCQGGHAVVLVGYDETRVMPDGSKGAFLVRNSWGTAWGLLGYFWMAQNYVADPKLASDFWVVQSAPI